jgi:Peptidyl-tRNA hydrolase PTH2
MTTEHSFDYPVLSNEPSSRERADKIYLVTHADLSVGYQITQTAHVIAELAVAYPEHFNAWHGVSQSIIVLQERNSEALTELYIKARRESLTVQAFREPDLGDEITAIAFLPSKETVGLLSNLPLAGRNVNDSKDKKASENFLKKVSFAIQDSPEFRHGQLLRECYYAFIDHLSNKVDLHQHPSWRSIPMYSDEDKKNLLAQQPHPWVIDRGLTFFFTPEESRQPYSHDPRITSVMNEPHSLPGWNNIMSAFNNRKESLS